MRQASGRGIGRQGLGDGAGGGGFQAMAKKRRTTELTHQGAGKFIKGVRQDHHLGNFSEPVQERFSSFQRPHVIDHRLNVSENQTVAVH